MSDQIKCPKCKGSNIKEKPYKAAVGPGRGPQGDKLPSEEEYLSYECLDCGHVFYESDLTE